MYHEGNPGARILGGVCIMKELLGNKFLTNMFFCFFQKKPGARCMYHEPKIIKNPGKIASRTILQDFPSPRFFLEKTVEEGKKHNLVWSTNVPGERISLENEFPCRTNFPGERISLENESLENSLGKIVVRNIMVRQPTWKIPICFYVLEKFW